MTRKKKSSSGASEDWITTFGDLMSILLCFFLILFTLASQNISKEEMKKVMDEIRTGFLKTVNKTEKKEPEIQKQKSKVAKDIQKVVLENELKDYIDVIIEEKKIKITFKQPIVFNSGSATLKESFKAVLSDITSILAPVPHPIFIEGHTDNVPIHTREFESNWELSFARAYSIIKYLQKKNIDPSRLSGTGYGEYRPVAPNDTPENKARNRRIEMNILFAEIQDKKEKTANSGDSSSAKESAGKK